MDTLQHLRWIGLYIIEKKPDVIIQIGDFADMPSLSSYDKGKKSFEGRRYKKDIAAAKKAMDTLLGPLREYNAKQRQNRHAQYKPRMILTLGNHEERIARVGEMQSELDGVVGYEDLPYGDWEVVPPEQPVVVDGVSYCHYFKNPNSIMKPVVTGQMHTKLNNLGHSFSMGHQQQLQYGLKHLSNGDTLHGLVAGACYLHDEDYLGPQGNHYWRGIILKHRVQNGEYDPCFISLDYLKERYG